VPPFIVTRTRTWADAVDSVMLEALPVCVLVAATLRWWGPTRVARLSRPLSRPRVSGGSVDVHHVVVQVDRVAYHLRLRSPCLVRSATTQLLLARRGVTTVLRIGVRRDDEGLDAHAWLERDGVILNDTPENCARYAAFADPVELTSRTHLG
jgi:hypothetical protein